MPRIISKARQLRFDYQAKIGRAVSVQEVANAIGVDRKRMTQIELDNIERLDMGTLMKLCSFYGVTGGDVLEYDPNKMTRELAAALPG